MPSEVEASMEQPRGKGNRRCASNDPSTSLGINYKARRRGLGVAPRKFASRKSEIVCFHS